MSQPTLAASAIQSFLAQNGLTSLQDLKPHDKAHLDQLDWAGLDREAAQPLLAAHRRLASLGSDHDLRERLLAHGLTSASQIASIPAPTFVREYAAALALSPEQAAQIHKRAVKIQNKVMHLFAAVHGTAASSHFMSTRVANVADEVADHFQDLPSYQEIFGSLHYCACDECKSIFGPAAYFVDLMRIVDEWITKPNEATIKPEFRLDARRPDLAKIELTCSNTSTLIPYLQIVNERLIATVLDRYELDDADTALFYMASKFQYPLNLPFNQPLQQVRVLLGQVNLSLGALYAGWSAPNADVVAESLGLSPEQLLIVTTPETDPTKVAPFYDIKVDKLQDLQDLELFMSKTGLTVPEVQGLIVQGVSQAEIDKGVPQNLFINQGLGADFLQLVSDQTTGTTTIKNLNAVALDQINRLRRLATSLGWSTPVADWLLRAVKAGATPAIDAAALADLRRLTQVAKQLQLTPLQAGLFLGPIKTYGGDGEGGPDPFDQLFNAPSTVADKGAYHPAGDPLNPLYADAPLPWTPGSTDAADTAAILRVLPGIGLELNAVNTLGLALFGANPITLTVANLSALVRHSLLARSLELPIDQYLTLLDLVGLKGATIFTGETLDRLLAAWSWAGDAGLNAYQLQYILRGTESVFVDPRLDKSQALGWLDALPAIVPATAADVEAKVDAQIAIFFGASQVLISPLRAMAVTAAPPPDGLTWAEAFLKLLDGAPQFPDYVLAVLKLIAQWLVFTSAVGAPADLMASVQATPASYGIDPNFLNPTVANLESVQSVLTLVRRYGDRRGNLIRYINLAAATSPTAAGALAALQRATGWNPDQVTALLTKEIQETNAVTRLLRLATCFDQMAAIGGDVSFLRGVVGLAGMPASAWESYKALAAQVYAKVSNRYGDRWASVEVQVNGRLNTGLRDGLLGLTLTSLRQQYVEIRTPINVYEFLLTDVETGPEAEISYIKEALNAVQLYLQRVRLGLEPGVEVMEIPPVWWDWIMNYRVWEANRRIFLYPENYLIPSARRDKTTLFEELENTLLQSEVTAEYVEEAYTTYIDGLLNLAELQPVDAFHGEIDDPQRGRVKATYLFARTMTEPYTFYSCRQLEGRNWSEWEKIDLSINSPYVTAVYAFSKLFLFWVHVEQVSTPNIDLSVSSSQTTANTSTNVTYRATIQYSFQNRTGSWVQPQNLVQGKVILYEGQGRDAVPDSLFKNQTFDTLFAMNQVAWQRVFPMRVANPNLGVGLDQGKENEHLVIFYSPFLINTPASIPLSNITYPSNPDGRTFTAELVAASRVHNQMLGYQMTGFLPFVGGYVLDSSLNATPLIHNQELMLVDAYTPKSSLAQFRPEVNPLRAAVQVVPSDTVVADNWLGDQPELTDLSVEEREVSQLDFITTGISATQASVVMTKLQEAGVINPNGLVDRTKLATLNLYETVAQPLYDQGIRPNQLLTILRILYASAGAPALFQQIDANRAHLVMVKNQPGWFLLNNGDETFLLEPQLEQGAPDFKTLDAGLIVSPPLYHTGSFLMSAGSDSISYATSKEIFDILVGYKVLDASGYRLKIPDIDTLDTLLGNLNLNQKQLKAIQADLANQPMIQPDAFVFGRIDQNLSKELYEALQTYGLITLSQRVHTAGLSGERLDAALGTYVINGKIEKRDLYQIYRIMVESPVPLAFTYRDATAPSQFAYTGLFKTTRLTTAAVPRLERALFSGGIERLLSLQTQQVPVRPILPFDRLKPTDRVGYPLAVDGAQVDFEGLYRLYFWELFYHGPMLVAHMLESEQRFREALVWFGYVFNPVTKEAFVTKDTFWRESDMAISQPLSQEVFDSLKAHGILVPVSDKNPDQCRVIPTFTARTDLSFLSTLKIASDQILMVRNVLLNYKLATPASRFWQFQPFRDHTLETLQQQLEDDNPAVKAYNDDPFDPFAIANLRIGAYEKATLMQYIDALIRWGDNYFMQDTWESLTAATMLYVYAYDLLGPRPQEVGTCNEQKPATFAQIREKYKGKEIPQFLIDLEDHVPPTTRDGESISVGIHGFNDLGTYFCFPENQTLISYWDRVEDRLYKIRHSLNIKGEYRALALFEPPLDPMALIRAAGASNNFLPAGSSQASKTPPPYRFRVALERAKGLANSAAALGGEFLATLEKKDAEQLALLRTTQEEQILSLTTRVRQQQIAEVEATLAGLNESLAGAQARLDFYTTLLDKGLSASERTNLDAMAVALAFNITSSVLAAASGVAFALPNVGSPFAMTYGGQQVGSALSAASAAAQIGSEISNYVGQRSLTMAGYERRAEEWQLQKSLAQHEVNALQEQITATQDRLAQAKQELVVHQETIEQNQAIEAFLKQKFTNEELYGWMVGQLSAVYFQLFQLALQAANSAQVALQFELDSDQTFLNLTYWDSLRKGLLAGDWLKLTLDQMEATFADGNTRTLEIERTLSLAQLAPGALEELKRTGACDFYLSEALFDYDFPGHYARKVKSISLSIPAVVGPYQNVKATLTQTQNWIATNNQFAGTKYLLGLDQKSPTPPPANSGVRVGWASDQQIALSRGMDDSGLFTLDFHDERYLPFEGTGVVSNWHLEMPLETNRFDFAQLSDVIITLRYTARNGGSALRDQVTAELAARYPLTVGYYLDLPQSYPIDWQAFMQNHSDPAAQSLTFLFTPTWQGMVRELTLGTVMLRFDAAPSITWPASIAIGILTIDGTAKQIELKDGVASLTGLNLKREAFTGPWQLTIDLQAIKGDPNLSALLTGEGWLDPLTFRGVEAILVTSAKVFEA